MAYTTLQAKITARAVIIRYKQGEGSVDAIIASYSLNEANAELVKAQIALLDPTIPLVPIIPEALELPQEPEETDTLQEPEASEKPELIDE